MPFLKQMSKLTQKSTMTVSKRLSRLRIKQSVLYVRELHFPETVEEETSA